MQCHYSLCSLWNTWDSWAYGKLRTERRYDPQFRGPTLPFGSEIFNHPISTRVKSKLRQISSKVVEVEGRVPLDRRGTRRRSERQRCIRSLCQKIQRERSENSSVGGQFSVWQRFKKDRKVHIVTPPTRVDLVRMLLRISVDALQEKERFWKLFCGDIMFEPRKIHARLVRNHFLFH